MVSYPRSMSVVVLTFIVCNCGDVQHRQQDSPQDVHEAAAARSVFEAFLNESRVTNENHVPDSLFTCDVPGMTDRRIGLASSEVLSVDLRGDSALASAWVVSVADETESGEVADLNVATIDVRTDTLQWRLTRNPQTGRWGVCGYSLEGVDFMWGGRNVRRTWRPQGASLERARAMADSIRLSVHSP